MELKVNGNSKGVGGPKNQNVKRNVWSLTGISRGVGGLKPKNLPCEGYGYFLEQHNNNKYVTKSLGKSVYTAVAYREVLITI